MGKSKKRPRPNSDDNPNQSKKFKPKLVKSGLDKAANHRNADNVGPGDSFEERISEWIRKQDNAVNTMEMSLRHTLVKEGAAEEENDDTNDDQDDTYDDSVKGDPDDRLNEDGDDDDDDAVYYEALESSIKKKIKNSTPDEKYRRFKFECEWKKCVFMSGNESKYMRHVEHHANIEEQNKNGKYECQWDLCDFRSSNHSDFAGHVHLHVYHNKLKVHGASLSMLLKFPKCHYDSRIRNNISQCPTSYTCEWENCDEKFSKAMEFYHHAKYHMIDLFPLGRKSMFDNPKPCRWSICKTQCVELSRSLRHLKTHTGERDVACFNCGVMCTTTAAYRDHCNRQVEAAYRKYQCDTCNKTFATNRLLKVHSACHILKYACPSCPRKAHTKQMIAVHFRQMHTNERTFTCMQCDYRSFTKDRLRIHMISHSSEKLFRCEEFGCGASFKCDASLQKHIAKHYNIPPNQYRCHMCESVYTRGDALMRHLFRKHSFVCSHDARRNRYKIDENGMYRLILIGQTVKNEHEEAAVSANVGVTLSKDGVPLKQETKINSIKMTGDREISIDLGIEFVETKADASCEESPALKCLRNKKEKSIPYQSKEKIRSVEKKDDRKANKPKNVQEFTVMQRYLRTGKMVKSSE